MAHTALIQAEHLSASHLTHQTLAIESFICATMVIRSVCWFGLRIFSQAVRMRKDECYGQITDCVTLNITSPDFLLCYHHNYYSHITF